MFQLERKRPHIDMTVVCKVHRPRWHQGLRMRESSPTVNHGTCMRRRSYWHRDHRMRELSFTWENPGFTRCHACQRMIRLCRGHRRIMRRTFISPEQSSLVRKPLLIRKHDASPLTQTCSPQAHYLLTRQPSRSWRGPCRQPQA